MIHTDTKVVRSVLRGVHEGFDIIAEQGGTYSGKTFGVLLAIYILMRNSKEGYKIRVIGQSVPHLQDGAMDDWMSICDEMGGYDKYSASKSKFTVGSSTIRFLSMDKLGKAKGAKFDITFANEANELNYPIMLQLILRTDVCTILDWNPSSEFWFHSKIITDKSKKILFKRSTYKDNPGVSEKKIREIEGLKDVDEQLYRVYALGLNGQIKGLIFKFERAEVFPKDCKKVAYGLDFGFTNDETALVIGGQLHGKLFGKQLIYETGLTNPMIVNRMEALGIPKNAEIYADSSEPKSIAEIKSLGYRNIKGVKKGPGSVDFGIQLIKQYGAVNIETGSTGWISEAKKYKWKVDSNGDPMNVPIDKYNHCWDAFRYYAVSKLTASKGGLFFAKPKGKNANYARIHRQQPRNITRYNQV